jgi:hypothetical protein
MSDRRAREVAGSALMALGVAVIVWPAVLARLSQWTLYHPSPRHRQA